MIYVERKGPVTLDTSFFDRLERLVKKRTEEDLQSIELTTETIADPQGNLLVLRIPPERADIWLENFTDELDIWKTLNNWQPLGSPPFAVHVIFEE